MDKMKRFIFTFVAIMFLVNGFAVSAWAKPCMNMSVSDMPCHEQQEEQSPAPHCGGVCLCFHASVNQTPILSDNMGVDVPLVSSAVFLSADERVVTMATAPPRRPPKFYS